MIDVLSPISPESLFKAEKWFRIENLREAPGQGTSTVSYKWIRRTLEQLVQANFQEDFAEYYLAFEYQNEPETIKKISKGLLKKHPASLRLYNSYAMIERSRGNKETAKSVFAAALKMSKSMSQKAPKNDSIILWRNWIWACLEDRENDSALRHLLSISDNISNIDTTLSPAILLKCKQRLTSNRDYLMSSGDLKHSVTYAECKPSPSNILAHFKISDLTST